MRESTRRKRARVKKAESIIAGIVMISMGILSAFISGDGTAMILMLFFGAASFLNS